MATDGHENTNPRNHSFENSDSVQNTSGYLNCLVTHPESPSIAVVVGPNYLRDSDPRDEQDLPPPSVTPSKVIVPTHRDSITDACHARSHDISDVADQSYSHNTSTVSTSHKIANSNPNPPNGLYKPHSMDNLPHASSTNGSVAQCLSSKNNTKIIPTLTTQTTSQASAQMFGVNPAEVTQKADITTDDVCGNLTDKATLTKSDTNSDDSATHSPVEPSPSTSITESLKFKPMDSDVNHKAETPKEDIGRTSQTIFQRSKTPPNSNKNGDDDNDRRNGTFHDNPPLHSTLATHNSPSSHTANIYLNSPGLRDGLTLADPIPSSSEVYPPNGEHSHGHQSTNGHSRVTGTISPVSIPTPSSDPSDIQIARSNIDANGAVDNIDHTMQLPLSRVEPYNIVASTDVNTSLAPHSPRLSIGSSSSDDPDGMYIICASEVVEVESVCSLLLKLT